MSAIVLAGILVRAMILFATPLMPKINGAYYLVQARSILERGRLAFNDFPLLFWIEAAVAWTLHHLGISESEYAILLASKLTDAILPILAAVAVFALVRRFQQADCSGAAQSQSSAPLLPAVMAAALSLWHASALVMIGDFQKNSLGMVWFACLLWSLHRVESNRGYRRWWPVAAFFILGGITHVGALAAIIVCLTAWTITRLWSADSWRRALMLSLLGAVGIAVMLLVVFVFFDATRAQRLTLVLIAPTRIFQHSVLSTVLSPGRPVMSPPGLVNMLAINALAVAALFLLWPQRRNMNHADRTLGGTLILCCLLLASPLINSGWADRLLLMAYLPAAALLGLVMTRLRRRHWRRMLAGLAAAICLGSVLAMIGPLSQPTIPVASVNELRSLSRQIEHPQRTLIVARHGLEWWAAWCLHTNVAQGFAVEPQDWSKYDRVMFLRQVRRDVPPGRPSETLPSSPSTRPSEPLPSGPPARHIPPPPGMPDVPIPQGATILAEGSYFVLATTDQPAAGYPLPHPPQ